MTAVTLKTTEGPRLEGWGI